MAIWHFRTTREAGHKMQQKAVATTTLGRRSRSRPTPRRACVVHSGKQETVRGSKLKIEGSKECTSTRS